MGHRVVPYHRENLYCKYHIRLYKAREVVNKKLVCCKQTNAGDGIRTRELLRDRTLNPAPLEKS